jgi:hypothetical protein
MIVFRSRGLRRAAQAAMSGVRSRVLNITPDMPSRAMEEIPGRWIIVDREFKLAR